MAKDKILEDTFEQLAELGTSTAKKTVKSMGQILNPFSSENNSSQSPSDSQTEQLKNKKNNHTPLDFEKLNAKFQNREKQKTQALRNRLFQMVKQADERLLVEKKQKELEKKRREELEKQEKKKKEEEKKKKQQGTIPGGKIRRSIFSPKKAAQQQLTEVRPATGKQ